MYAGIRKVFNIHDLTLILGSEVSSVEIFIQGSETKTISFPRLMVLLSLQTLRHVDMRIGLSLSLSRVGGSQATVVQTTFLYKISMQ